MSLISHTREVAHTCPITISGSPAKRSCNKRHRRLPKLFPIPQYPQSELAITNYQSFNMLSYDSPLTMNGQKPHTTSLPPPYEATSPNNSVMTSKISKGRHSANTDQEHYHHIWLVTGPAGCGKSTIAEYLANVLDMPFIEGDSVSSKSLHDTYHVSLTSTSFTPKPMLKR